MAASTPTTEEDFSDDVLTDDVEEDMPGEAVDEMALEPPLPATEGPTLDSYQAIITAFMEFLTVATHTILYERNIYPRASFLRARKYDYPVRQNRHPGVCKFIMDAMTAIEAEMIKSIVSNVSLIIHPVADPTPTERFVFSVAAFPFIPLGQAHSILSPRLSFSDLSAQFTAVLSRLSTTCGRLPPLPSAEVGEFSFLFAIEMRHGVPRKREGWIPAVMGLQPDTAADYDGTSDEEKQTQEDDKAEGRTEERKAGRGHLRGGERSLPVRAVELGRFVMEVWVEEAKREDTRL